MSIPTAISRFLETPDTALLARFARWELAGPVGRLPSVLMRGVVRRPLRLSF